MSTERYPKKLAAELHQFRITDETGPSNVLSFVVMPCFHGDSGWFGLLKNPETNSWLELLFEKEKAKLHSRPVFVSGSVPRWFR